MATSLYATSCPLFLTPVDAFPLTLRVHGDLPSSCPGCFQYPGPWNEPLFYLHTKSSTTNTAWLPICSSFTQCPKKPQQASSPYLLSSIARGVDWKVKMHARTLRSNRMNCATVDESSILPVPYLLEEVSHVDFLRLHLHHPWVLEHTPWSCSSWAFFLEAGIC